MATPNSTQASQNRYNPNSGSQGDIIDQMIAQGMSDDQIYATLKQLQNQGATESAAPSTGVGDLTFEQLQALSGVDPEQQQTDNLLTLYKLLQGDQQQQPQQQQYEQIPLGAQTTRGGGFQSTGDGYGDRFAADQARREFDQSLLFDKVMRERNKKDALWAAGVDVPDSPIFANAAGLMAYAQNRPHLPTMPQQPAQAGPTQDPRMAALLDAIMSKLMPRPAEPAAPPAPDPTMTPQGNKVGSTPAVFETGNLPPNPSRPEFTQPNDIQQQIRNRLLGGGR